VTFEGVELVVYGLLIVDVVVFALLTRGQDS